MCVADRRIGRGLPARCGDGGLGASATDAEAPARTGEADVQPAAQSPDATAEGATTGAPDTNANANADGATAPQQQAPARPKGRFAEELRYATYPVDALPAREARMTHGVFESAVAGSGARAMAQLAPRPVFGDLNGDRVEDAAVALLVTPGGSGSFTYVAAVVNVDGDASPTNAMLIGDRVALQSMRVVDGEINVSWMDRKPGDPMTSEPATPVTRTFVVEGGKLVAKPGA